MEELKEKIINYLEKKKKKIKITKLVKLFSTNEEEKNLILNLIRELEIEGKIYINNSDECCKFPSNDNLIQSKLRKDSKGNYFVCSNTRVITINEKLLNNALLNDIVVVETDSLSNLKNCGKVKKIIQRHNSLLVVDYNIVDNKPYFKPVDNFLDCNINLSDKYCKNFVPGDRLVLNVIDHKYNNKLDFEFVKSLGHKDDPNLEIKTLLVSKDIPIDFNEKVIKELDDIPNCVNEDEIKDREKQLKASGLAIEILQEAYKELRDNFGPILNKNVVESFKNFTDGKYSEVMVADNYEMKVRNEKNIMKSEVLSNGANDQLNLSLRLAFIDMIFKSKDVSIYLDDAFVQYDNKRIENTIKYLVNYNFKQCIIFTCHNREESIISKHNIKHKYIKLLT